MKCDPETIHGILEDSLDPESAARAREHVLACEHCSRELGELFAARQALAALMPSQATGAFPPHKAPSMHLVVNRTVHEDAAGPAAGFSGISRPVRIPVRQGLHSTSGPSPQMRLDHGAATGRHAASRTHRPHMFHHLKIFLLAVTILTAFSVLLIVTCRPPGARPATNVTSPQRRTALVPAATDSTAPRTSPAADHPASQALIVAGRANQDTLSYLAVALQVTPGDGVVTHRVKKHETLWDISVEHYGSGAYSDEIARRNGITDPRRMSEGLAIRLPRDVPEL
ncbi:MAG: LysM peptidoglycan-binding domain-containing protein [Planctomycetes bacterium]|nr:LysM peptidoglycan-binding domain-containing protein [Planctomycetota bacterium]